MITQNKSPFFKYTDPEDLLNDILDDSFDDIENHQLVTGLQAVCNYVPTVVSEFRGNKHD